MCFNLSPMAMRILLLLVIFLLTSVTDGYEVFNSCIQGAVHDAVNHKCYIVRHKSVTHDEAERNCENMESVLAIVENMSQQSVLNNFTENERYWIGANDQAISRDYKNPDGTDVTFFYWHGGQPNDDVVANDQACVHMTSWKEWHDDECYNRERYLCQIYKPFPIVQVHFKRVDQTIQDVEPYRVYSAESRLYCQVYCLRYPVCIAYIWDPYTEVDNCQLLTPLLGNIVNVTDLDKHVYEAVER